ncbi:hypothetical protein [Halegenticoccus soli]|uniref:hypothetical protein n=1 Tax=Halegenticoccus soli TaxID=1985678 RepID=UPI000C6CCBEC|nr:hypothetical protein [Halegenticoccus soli]
MSDTFTTKAKENVTKLAQETARESAKELIKEAVREANEESSSGSSRRVPGLLLLGVGAGIGYLLAGRRFAAAAPDDSTAGESAKEITVEAPDESDEGTGGGSSGPGPLRLLLLLGGVAVGSYLVRKKRGSKPDELSDLADDVVSDVEEVAPSGVEEDGEASSGGTDEEADRPADIEELGETDEAAAIGSDSTEVGASDEAEASEEDGSDSDDADEEESD